MTVFLHWLPSLVVPPHCARPGWYANELAGLGDLSYLMGSDSLGRGGFVCFMTGVDCLDADCLDERSIGDIGGLLVLRRDAECASECEECEGSAETYEGGALCTVNG